MIIVKYKGAWANGRYYDGDSGQAVTNRFVQVGANKWAYLNQNGQKVVGLQHINGKLYYFEGNGSKLKGNFWLTEVRNTTLMPIVVKL